MALQTSCWQLRYQQQRGTIIAVLQLIRGLHLFSRCKRPPNASLVQPLEIDAPTFSLDSPHPAAPAPVALPTISELPGESFQLSPRIPCLTGCPRSSDWDSWVTSSSRFLPRSSLVTLGARRPQIRLMICTSRWLTRLGLGPFAPRHFDAPSSFGNEAVLWTHLLP